MTRKGVIIYINKYVGARRGKSEGWLLARNNVKESLAFKIDLGCRANCINWGFTDSEFLNFRLSRLIPGINNILKHLLNLIKRTNYF